MEKQRNGERKRNKKNTQKGGGSVSHSTLGTWRVRGGGRGGGGGGGGGGARGTQSAAYTTVPAGKRRHFCLRLNPYTACCSETPFMFAAFHWTPLTFKGYAWAIERSKVDHGCTGERYSRGGKDQMICCVLEGREDRTEPACCQKQVWSKKKEAVKARWKYGTTKPHSLQQGNKDPRMIRCNALVFMLARLV